ncbi:hypothetical protein YC2023_048623 [Brassica napus]
MSLIEHRRTMFREEESLEQFDCGVNEIRVCSSFNLGLLMKEPDVLTLKFSRHQQTLSFEINRGKKHTDTSLILGSGDTFYTAVASFRFRETVALTAPDFAGDRLRESGGSDSTVLSPASSPI